MNLYIVQHAEALSEDIDPSRSLSENGIKDIRKTVSFLKGLNIRVKRILHSGKTRALQTAEILSEGIDSANGVSASEGLAPKDDPGIWLERLETMEGDLMIVGHLPHLSSLLSGLLKVQSKLSVVEFEMGGVICVKRDEAGNWRLDWIIKPRILR